MKLLSLALFLCVPAPLAAYAFPQEGDGVEPVVADTDDPVIDHPMAVGTETGEHEVEGDFEDEFGGDFEDLSGLSLDELFDMEVTVVSRSGGDLRRTPAAVYVITGEEIRRSGHTSIQEALRMVPGFYVSRWTTLNWDVTSRGFGNGIAGINVAYLNQLLVMVDGVVVYTPLFAGVWWPLLDMDMGEVDRIEVVRGPAGVMWGSNAVHGVVHVITKKSEDTQGWRAFYSAGTRDHHGGMRYGGELGENGNFRAWFKRAQYTALENPPGGFREGYTMLSAGMRADWELESGRTWNAWTRVYEATQDQLAFYLDTFEPYVDESPKNGQTLFVSTQAPDNGGVWQAWYSRDEQDIKTFADTLIEVFDLEYRKDFEVNQNNTLSVGGGYRHIKSDLSGDDPFYLDYDPNEVTQDNFRVFAYDVWRFPEQDVELSLGLQAEHTEFTDFELQPTARAAFILSDHDVLWGGVTRAVRTPSLEERTLTPESFVVGSESFDSEELLSYELGYRHQAGPDTAYDLSLFFNEYDNQAIEMFDDDAGEYVLTNESSGEAYGAELAMDFRISDVWRMRSAYSYLVATFMNDADGTRLFTGEQSPKHLFNIRSYYDIGDDWEFDLGLYVVEGMGEALELAEYWRTDARLGWRPADGLELAFGVQSATDNLRSEYDEFDNIRQAFYVSLTIEK